jgi:ribosomal protein S24E
LPNSDILHPNRANISKEELRDKIATLYKANKEQVSVFGLKTQFGGGKTTGFALVYDSPEAMKKFEPHYRLVRVGLASKIEKASRQQRTLTASPVPVWPRESVLTAMAMQASSARTDRRPSAARRRSRVRSRRRRNKRLAFSLVCVVVLDRAENCSQVDWVGRTRAMAVAAYLHRMPTCGFGSRQST